MVQALLVPTLLLPSFLQGRDIIIFCTNTYQLIVLLCVLVHRIVYYNFSLGLTKEEVVKLLLDDSNLSDVPSETEDDEDFQPSNLVHNILEDSNSSDDSDTDDNGNEKGKRSAATATIMLNRIKGVNPYCSR